MTFKFSANFRRILIYQFRGDPFGVPWSRRTDGQGKMIKLIVAYSNISITLARDEYPRCQGYWSLPSQHLILRT